MSWFARCLGNGGVSNTPKTSSTPRPPACSAAVSAKSSAEPAQHGLAAVNEGLLRLLPPLGSLEGGWHEQVQGTCKLLLEHLDADHVSVSVRGSDGTATPVAGCGCAEEDLAAMWLGGTSHDTCWSVVLASSINCDHDSRSSCALMLREAHHTAAAGAAARAKAASICFSDNPSRLGEALPSDWRWLREKHGCKAFARVPVVVAGEPVGCLSLAAKGSVRPASWTEEALLAVATVLAKQVRHSLAPLTADALSMLQAAGCVSDLVGALDAVARVAAERTAHVGGQARVAFLNAEMGAAAIFQQPAAGGRQAALPDVLRREHSTRRSSLEFVMASSSRANNRRTSLESALCHTPAAAASIRGAHHHYKGGWRVSTDTRGAPSAASTVLKEPSEGDVGFDDNNRIMAVLRNFAIAAGSTQEASRRGCVGAVRAPSVEHSCSSFHLQPVADKVPSCRGHTLALKGTLLSEALTRGAAGLCIADCNAYIQGTKAYPRDLVLSRDGVMPQSLALATVCHEGRPLLALYATFATVLPQGLLQAVVQELRQVLQAVLPTVVAKLTDQLVQEWAMLLGQLQKATVGRGRSRSRSGVHDGSLLPSRMASVTDDEHGPGCEASTAGTGAGDGGLCIGTPDATEENAQARHLASLTTMGDTANACAAYLTATGTNAGHTAADEGYMQGLSNGMPPVADDGGGAVQRPASKAGTAVVRALCPQAFDGEEGVVRARSWAEGALGAAAKPKRLLNELRGASFRLEAAQAPRGASKLQPIIATIHERLKAAQAVQMANARAASRQEELASLQLLQPIGKGGYGVVYRGTFHGAEVAVKVVLQAKVAPPGASAALSGGAAGAATTLHKHHLHDAIELVASSHFNHPNIVQILTHFTDVSLKLPNGDNPSAIFDSRDCDDVDAGGRVPQLQHMVSLLESGQHVSEPHGAAMALVLEYCDAGSLADAITGRTFMHRVKKPVETPQSDGGTKQETKSFVAINMRHIYATLLEVALALRHMHSLHVVHCDLKPQNVLLKSSPRDPRGFTAKLSDFGLAKMMAVDDDGQLVIDDTVGSGTVTHIAPEVLRGQNTLGAEVDVYAFGVLMWQVLCGMRLYDDMAAQDIAQRVVHDNLRPQFPSWAPKGYRSLAERCWHPTAAARPSSEELVREVEGLLKQLASSSA